MLGCEDGRDGRKGGGLHELDFIARLRAMATDPAARGLTDDAAVWRDLVLTHDMIVEGVHYLPDDRPQDVAWKLLAVNLSDLAAKGAKPEGVLMGYSMTGDAAWDAAFAEGLQEALSAFNVALLGGDTVRMPMGAPRTLGLTAIGTAPSGGAPERATMQVGDILWVSGMIGDAGLGLALRLGELQLDEALDVHAAYALPVPRLALGQALAGRVTAMMDISDGLLLDAWRMAEASGCGLTLALDNVPLSPTYIRARGDDVAGRLAAATAGDDYELLFSAAESAAPEIFALAAECGVPVARIGRADEGPGMRLFYKNKIVDAPEVLGFLHQ
ncbi:MAG TPA: thiamine-phosphate kinase [Sphingopyxis sp.]|nr:thiamine-phosphate kinase [Sphingopyxis sp.]